MQKHLRTLIPILCVLALCQCKEKQEPVIWQADYSENYKYYPIIDGREWNYEIKIVDSIHGTVEFHNELARFYEDSARTIYYRNGTMVSSLYWLNDNNKLGCCKDVVLIDYSQLGCRADSVIIYQSEKPGLSRVIYQFCQKTFASEVENYQHIKCIKTLQINSDSSGNTLRITQLFGYEIGLIYREETSFDEFGKVLTQRTQKLVSHKF